MIKRILRRNVGRSALGNWMISMRNRNHLKVLPKRSVRYDVFRYLSREIGLPPFTTVKTTTTCRRKKQSGKTSLSLLSYFKITCVRVPQSCFAFPPAYKKKALLLNSFLKFEPRFGFHRLSCLSPVLSGCLVTEIHFLRPRRRSFHFQLC